MFGRLAADDYLEGWDFQSANHAETLKTRMDWEDAEWEEACTWIHDWLRHVWL